MFPSLVSLSIHLAVSSDSYFWAYQPLISPFFKLTSSSPELILPSVVATQVEPSIAQSVAAAYYPGVDKCESTAFSPTLSATDGNLEQETLGLARGTVDPTDVVQRITPSSTAGEYIPPTRRSACWG